AGPIGLELAQAFFHFGSQVTILEKGDQILRETDFAVADELMYHLQNEGIKIQLGVDIKQLSRDGDMKVINMLINNEMVTIDANEILMATGVIPNSEKLGLAKAGVNVNPQGFILTNNNFQTSVSHIYAVGDVVGNAFLETIAAKEGYYAATNALEDENKSIDYSSIPRAVFTFPQVATVGISEEEYMEQYNYCECRTIEISTIPKAKALKETRGIIKMVIHPETDVIAGVQIVSPMAADLIHEATLAVKYKMTIDDIIDTVHVFPTMSEGIKRVAQAFRRDISIMSCCIN
ncbi:MAG: FAD-dependent oxidoreductase, partial [Candidatus Heimdallarchaeota archaeon]|nr:FAD-dependent oxidoreductase [Candidatus Heimdallarchaeota archaeon]